MDKKTFSFRVPLPHERGSAPGPRWGSAPNPPFRLALHALAMVPLGKSWISQRLSGLKKGRTWQEVSSLAANRYSVRAPAVDALPIPL